MSEDKLDINSNLFADIQQLIDHGKQQVAQAVNIGITATYWNIGKRIKEDILENKRADYGKQILHALSAKLTLEYGSGYSAKNLNRMMQFYESFSDNQIVATLWRQLSWSHFKLLIPLNTDLEREFYAQMCRIENWSTRTLQKKIDSMLFERTAISKKPEELAKLELQVLKESDKLSPDLVFKDHYVLDFLNLKDTYAEKDLEAAILREIENFLIELGSGFTFVARQKRMIIDNTDFNLDLLFYHRKLKRLIAIDLKIGKFKPAYKGQMELYLRYLEKHDTEPDEERPIGLILCAEGNQEQIELLQLDKANIKVAEYITQHLPKELLAKKLHQFTITAKRLIEKRDKE
ncbi:PDDEXK nuclease domain-containing protein [Plebeiibacterium sediminum]|uniref:PDDEXK nuclease domain-containing protein n=1 Tax=Plebeiibacterium sediminum TaxID=2992112 RepID=A0AAE3M925_9BACT|nr:PDDEXK nuclease domain-containing protein [Plebeiobacterium sediminum]MCW3789246.1 PDDEXK nuclease domain-containing protein [Plebeiobacterium sediminum]